MTRRRASVYNTLWEASAEVSRFVCAHCLVPFGLVVPNERRIVSGYDEHGFAVYICPDCQRQLPDYEDEDDWDVLT